MIRQVILPFAFLAVAVWGETMPSYHHPAPSYHSPTPAPTGPAQYAFNYGVRDEESLNSYNHHETRDGYNTDGSYYVLLPDGRQQKITYTVNGDSGFVAEVSYEGNPDYPTFSTTPAPSHKYVPPNHPHFSAA